MAMTSVVINQLEDALGVCLGPRALQRRRNLVTIIAFLTC